jgi:hypothetical protein
MHRAKFLSKSCIASTKLLSCLRTNNELSLGVLLHLKCIYFFKKFSQIFSPESHYTWIKLLNLTLYLAKVFFLTVFVGNKIGKKYHGSFSPKGGTWSLELREGSHDAQMKPGGASTSTGRATRACLALDRRLTSPLRVTSYIP